LNGASNFIITGSGDSNLDYNTTGAPLPYHASAGSNTFTFTTPVGVGTHSYTTGANPSLQLHPFVAWTYDASNNACPGGGGGGTSAGPCPNWIHYDVFKNIRNQTTATAGYPGITWPSPAGTGGSTISNWCGANVVSGMQMGDYCEAYWSSTVSYLPTKQTLRSVYSGEGNANVGIRSAVYPAMNTQTPLIVETNGTMVDYLLHGYPITVASCAQNTITTATPHGLFNIYPDVTRVTVSGSSGGNCDGNFYVIATPTATTIQVALANNSFSPGGTGATVAFQDGTMFTGMTLYPFPGIQRAALAY
jgi:hypothetical protein